VHARARQDLTAHRFHRHLPPQALGYLWEDALANLLLEELAADEEDEKEGDEEKQDEDRPDEDGEDPKEARGRSHRGHGSKLGRPAPVGKSAFPTEAFLT